MRDVKETHIGKSKTGKTPKNRSFLFGAVVLGAGGILAKLLGVLYRIPLTNIVGAEGIGLYQMVFPFYTLLLTISGAGLPAAISKMTAEALARGDKRGADRIFKTALVSLSVLGLIASLLVFALHGLMARLQGNAGAALSYLGIAPALFFVALISAFRGYFQGRQNMLPTALSQITEQAVKIAFGLIFAKMLMRHGIAYAALGALIGVSVSELFAAIQLFIQYLFYRRREKKHEKKMLEYGGADAAQTGSKKNMFRQLFAISIPITLGAIILPATQLIDSALVINILKGGGLSVKISTVLYGLMTGHVMSVINMPVVLSVAVATAVMPRIAAAGAVGNKAGAEKSAGMALKAAFVTAVPCALIMCFFAPQIIRILYGRGLRDDLLDEGRIAAQLLSITSFSTIYIAVMQVITAALQAVGKIYVPVINLGIGTAIKIILNLALISIPSVGIYGAAISTCACYAVAAILDYIALRKYIGKCDIGLNEIFSFIRRRKKIPS